jgi:hypothetical protein
VENYFNYFTEIEERYQKRRGSVLLLSTLDWALIETWKDAGIPLAAALRGIDETFDKYERRPSKTRKVNSLAYCAQEVLATAEEMKEAAVGTQGESASIDEKGGFDAHAVAEYLEHNAKLLDKISLVHVRDAAGDTAVNLRSLAASVREVGASQGEDLERRLTVMEEKLFALVLANTPDDAVLKVREEADAAMAPYRRKMPSAQIEQLQKQFVHKRLLEKSGVPRLSLFYM